MHALQRKDLFSLEEYAEQRSEFRQRVLKHKIPRRVAIGEALVLYFEDRLTVQYQIQEMLRIEKIFEAAGIAEELETYNPLIPDGRNLKVTAMLEYQDVEHRKRRLAELRGLEDLVWLQVTGHQKVFAIANEDLERSNAEKTSAVHFMRFEFSPEMIVALSTGSELSAGCDHPNYPPSKTTLANANTRSLLKDFDDTLEASR